MRVGGWAVAVGLLLQGAVAGPVLEARREPGIVWLLLVDDLHIDFRNTGVLRAWLGSLATALIREEDVFAVRTTGPSSVSVGLLAGMEDLQKGIRRISGSALKVQDLRQVPEGKDELALRARIAVNAATELLSTAPEHDARRRVLIYIGKGFDAVDGSVDETDSFLKEAWRHDVRVIAIDIGSLRAAAAPVVSPADPALMSRLLTARRTSLEQLALPTHGFVLADEASVHNAAKRISDAVR